MFPGLIPSTFESESQGRNRAFGDAMKTLRARQRVMEFVSATALATFDVEQQEVVRRSVMGDSITPKDIRLIGPYFNRNGVFSVYKIPDSIAIGLGRIVGVHKWYHSIMPTRLVAYNIRGRILRQYHVIREDDRLMRVEGIDKLNDEELILANQTRGMRWTENAETLRVQLEWWNSLSRDPTVPYNTLFWIKPTRYSLRKSMNNLPLEQRRQMLGIQNLPESVRSGLEALCDTVDTASKIVAEPETADKIVEKIADITDSAKMGDKDISSTKSIGVYLTEENVKNMFIKLRKNKSEEEPVLVSEVIEAIGHETHNSTHSVSNLLDAFDYGAGSKPITEAALKSIGARCRSTPEEPKATPDKGRKRKG
ncbi:MRS7 family protein [Angomonas deanei]|uniref:LETM1-like protein, putative n=1 Tax=Angomonas deanei TaxID=59799 RepID=A0A7G2CG40_9TRYP|nr:MRS7 family protein [Angomonas deanei]CAD2218479.1 LETM1-like protein, putative [Angomonas deanei]|eukprot:EPY43393.1 MRS7 family protein [Angomonas deanei]